VVVVQPLSLADRRWKQRPHDLRLEHLDHEMFTFILHRQLGTLTYFKVCNIIFSKTSNQFVTSYGASHHNLTIWSFPSFEKVASLDAHASRILFMSQSPDGGSIITGAGDETLKIWKVFPEIQKTDYSDSLL
jgi:WD40 repeat protein